ncbi:MAG: hypothetical protein ABWZ75_04135 [Novosphingobium sp.]
MATQYNPATLGAENSRQTQAAGKRYLIGPLADFFCFGGSALIILPLLLLFPAAKFEASLAASMMLAANFINHPHFAHSYQIFYRGFMAKAFTPGLSTTMRIRYIFAGLVVPVMLLGFIALCFIIGNVQLLGYAANAMALFVGWHYVKQGYGLLMVDCTLKRQFFSASEKKLLLINSYAVWIAAWTGANHAIAEKAMWGIQYYAFPIPTPFAAVAMAGAIAAGAATAWMLFSRWRATGGLPVNGVVAYFVSLYPWLLVIWINPLWLLVVPALHSLQYLAVVWRFQVNYETAQLADPQYKAGSIDRKVFGANPLGHLALFVIVGTILGFAGFWFLPIVLGQIIPHDQTVFGGTAFLFAAWIFINVHHYFIDNVMWRRENPDTKAYLFN